MTAHIIGDARVSTNEQDLTAQRNGLSGLGEALAAVRAGDTLVVTKLDRLARSLPDARDIIEDLTKRNVKLSIGGSVHDPTDPSADSSSTSWPWSPNSNWTSSEPAPAKACRSPKPKAGSAANNPN